MRSIYLALTMFGLATGIVRADGVADSPEVEPAAAQPEIHDIDSVSTVYNSGLTLAQDRPVSGEPSPEIPGINVTRDEINKWHKYFDLVIVVNKASSAQTLQVYKKDVADPILSTRVSTGTEEYRCHAVRDRATGNVIEVKKIFTQTPTGYYVADRLDIDHFSGAYDDAHMPFAVFLKDPTGVAEGIATHKAPGAEAERLVGNRESHACIRLHLKESQEVFKQVMMTGGPVDIDKDANMHAQCNPALDPMVCHQDAALRNGSYRKWLKGTGALDKTYPQMQEVPVINRDGTIADGQGHSFKLDQAGGREKMTGGYKTLYIVQDVENGKSAANKIVELDKNGKPFVRKAQKTEIKCPTADEINRRESRYPQNPNGWGGWGQPQRHCFPLDFSCWSRQVP